MKQLKNCVELSSCVKIYVPSTIDINKNYDTKEFVDKTLILLSQLFGGATSTKALGAWVSAKGDLIKEDVTLVYSYCHQIDLEKNINLLYDYCVNLRIELRQESIGLEVNNKLYQV